MALNLGIDFSKTVNERIFCDQVCQNNNFVWNISDLVNHYRTKEKNEELELKSIIMKRAILLTHFSLVSHFYTP